MKEGMKQMKKDMKPIKDIGKLEAMMDEMSDLMMDANEVSSSFSSSSSSLRHTTLRHLNSNLFRCKSAWAGRMT